MSLAKRMLAAGCKPDPPSSLPELRRLFERSKGLKHHRYAQAFADADRKGRSGVFDPADNVALAFHSAEMERYLGMIAAIDPALADRLRLDGAIEQAARPAEAPRPRAVQRGLFAFEDEGPGMYGRDRR